MSFDEWGGSLPLETNVARMPLFGSMPYASFDSGRSAIYAALLNLGKDEVWLPAYLCPTVGDFLRRFGVEVHEYHIDDDFLPIEDGIPKGSALVWTNWFGSMRDDVKREVVERHAPNLVIDDCHALFEPPVHGVQNVYSCRKFLGVPEGAFLVADDIVASFDGWETDERPFYDHLRKALRSGSDSAYDLYQENSARFAEMHRLLDPVVEATLSGFDYDAIRRKRSRNLEVLRGAFGDRIPEGIDPSASDPIWFPLYVEDDGLRQRLVESRVFVPRLWKRVLAMDDATPNERRLANHLFPLPLDQRYEPSDMEAMADKVEGLVNAREAV